MGGLFLWGSHPRARWPPLSTTLPALVRVLGLQTQDIARDAGLSPSTVSRALAGKQILSSQAVNRLELAVLHHLGTSVAEQRGEQGLPPHVEDGAALRQIARLVTNGGGGDAAA